MMIEENAIATETGRLHKSLCLAPYIMPGFRAET